MIAKEPENRKVKLSVTISPEVDAKLDEEAAETGNKSFLVEKIIRHYYGSNLNSQTEQLEKLAS